MKNNSPKYEFKYTDEHGQSISYKARLDPINIEVDGPLSVIVEQMERFLLSCGFAQESIDKYIKEE